MPALVWVAVFGWRTLTIPGYGGNLTWSRLSLAWVWVTGGTTAGTQPPGVKGPRSSPTLTWLEPRPSVKGGISTSFCGESARRLVKTGPASPKSILEVFASSFALEMHQSYVLVGRHRGLGEAAVPGPRLKKRAPRNDNLLDYNLVEPATVKLQDSAWREFERWLAAELDAGAIGIVLECPQLFVVLLAE